MQLRGPGNIEGTAQSGVLDLKVADLAADQEVLQQARNCVIEIFEKDPTHDNDVLMTNANNDYSTCLLNEHRFEKAGRCINECFDKYNKWGPEENNPFEYAKYYGNISIVLMWQGRLKEAEASQRKAVGLMDKFSGRGAPYYRRLFMLACILVQAGQNQAALDEHLEVLKRRIDLLGKNHEHTILSMYAVGRLYQYIGHTDMAM